MKENLTFLYNLIDEDVEDAEILQHVPVVNPVLIIRGQDLHHSENVYNAVINKDIVLHADSFADGLLITFLCYYVFGIVYPTEIEGTLEAIQRCVVTENEYKIKWCQKKKIEREKKEKIDHILQNTKKINSFFSKQEVTAEKSLEKSSIEEQALTLTANACDADTDTQTTNIIIVNEESSLLSPQKTQTPSSEKNGEKHEIATASPSKTETLIVQDELQISKSVEDFNIGNDPAEWHITDKNLIIDSILKNPPQQNIDELDFTTSARNYDENEYNFSDQEKEDPWFYFKQWQENSRNKAVPVENAENKIEPLVLKDVTNSNSHEQHLVEVSDRRGRVWDKKDRCPYCNKDVTNFSQHLFRKHSREESVSKILEVPKGNDFLLCKYCKRLYKRNSLSKHAKIFFFNNGNDSAIRYSSEGQTLLAFQESRKPFLDHLRLKIEVFNKMHADRISLNDKTDVIVCQYAEDYLRKHKRPHIKNLVGNKIRELGRLLIPLQDMYNINSMLEALKPENFDKVAAAARIIAGYDETTKTFQAPSLAMHLRTTSLVVCSVAKTLILKKYPVLPITNYGEVLKNVKNFRGYKIADEALENLRTNLKDLESFQKLSEAALALTVLINRKRVGDVQYMKLQSYESVVNSNKEDCLNILTDAEKELTKHFKRVITVGKGMLQILNLTEIEMEQVATFMGHTKKTHEEFYRLPQEVFQTSKVAKLLLMMKRGIRKEDQGKTLNEIDFQLQNWANDELFQETPQETDDFGAKAELSSDEESSLFLKEVIDKGTANLSESQLLRHFKPNKIAENLGLYQLMVKFVSSGQSARSFSDFVLR
ncbi:hypothetical protein NQ314_008848 [Rhamnusium bicolor]|uniref:C2H2-type domain-containing protein n=1 Tax=Rhamnusium bicolor TaxID=1586634 RepID=A0AAV8Y882_9CUCU|nr:hypothetical protein NQ314_008848 [Rhamnusium bicolor]